MQVLKEEVRRALLKSAKKEFLKHGYEGADMRRIAAGCGKSVGNAYRYYSGKEAIFDAIAPAGRLTPEMAEKETERFLLLAERRISAKGLPKFLKSLDAQIILELVK